MFLAVTSETGPAELVADSRKWTKIGENYYQSDTVDGICLELNQQSDGQYRWFLYDQNTPDPEMAVIQCDKPTLAEALTDALDYLSGYQTEESPGDGQHQSIDREDHNFDAY
jgi:hypothetical protein